MSLEEIRGLNIIAMIAMQSRFETGLDMIAILFHRDQICSKSRKSSQSLVTMISRKLRKQLVRHIWSKLERIAAIRLQSEVVHPDYVQSTVLEIFPKIAIKT